MTFHIRVCIQKLNKKFDISKVCFLHLHLNNWIMKVNKNIMVIFPKSSIQQGIEIDSTLFILSSLLLPNSSNDITKKKKKKYRIRQKQ